MLILINPSQARMKRGSIPRRSKYWINDRCWWGFQEHHCSTCAGSLKSQKMVSTKNPIATTLLPLSWQSLPDSKPHAKDFLRRQDWLQMGFFQTLSLYFKLRQLNKGKLALTSGVMVKFRICSLIRWWSEGVSPLHFACSPRGKRSEQGEGVSHPTGHVETPETPWRAIGGYCWDSLAGSRNTGPLKWKWGRRSPISSQNWAILWKKYHCPWGKVWSQAAARGLDSICETTPGQKGDQAAPLCQQDNNNVEPLNFFVAWYTTCAVPKDVATLCRDRFRDTLFGVARMSRYTLGNVSAAPLFWREGGSLASRSVLVQWRAAREFRCYTLVFCATLSR